MATIKITAKQPREVLTISQQRARIEGADMARIPHLLNPYVPGTDAYAQWQHGNDEAKGIFKPPAS